jgi:hypothetical protein
MSDGTYSEEDCAKSLSREEILAALATETVFDFDSHALGTIRVTPMLANTLERIAAEFEREGADDDAKLRCLLCEDGSGQAALAPARVPCRSFGPAWQ